MQHSPLEQGLERDPELLWGQKLRNYRERAGLTLAEAAAIINEAWPTSMMGLSRIENRDAPPTQRRVRIVAILALVVYGVHPEPMDLSFDELPAFVDQRLLLKAIKKARGSSASSRCTPQSFVPSSAFSFDAA